MTDTQKAAMLEIALHAIRQHIERDEYTEAGDVVAQALAMADQGERKPDDAKDAERYRKVLFQEYKDYQRKTRIAELSILPFNDYVNQYNAILDAPKWDDA